MGPLTAPMGGPAYLDANSFIYTVERIDPYRTVPCSILSGVKFARLGRGS